MARGNSRKKLSAYSIGLAKKAIRLADTRERSYRLAETRDRSYQPPLPDSHKKLFDSRMPAKETFGLRKLAKEAISLLYRIRTKSYLTRRWFAKEPCIGLVTTREETIGLLATPASKASYHLPAGVIPPAHIRIVLGRHPPTHPQPLMPWQCTS